MAQPIPPLRASPVRAFSVLVPFVVLCAASCSSASEPGSKPDAPKTRAAAVPHAAQAAKAPPPACAADHLPQSGLKRGPLTLHTERGPKKIEVERCLTPREQQIGMMCRPFIDDEHGMLFEFNAEQTRSFWMKNTLIPLDMVFINRAGSVVSVLENAEPLTLSSRRSEGPATYVLELRGGFAKQYGVQAGDKVTLPNPPLTNGQASGAGATP